MQAAVVEVEAKPRKPRARRQPKANPVAVQVRRRRTTRLPKDKLDASGWQSCRIEETVLIAAEPTAIVETARRIEKRKVVRLPVSSIRTTGWQYLARPTELASSPPKTVRRGPRLPTLLASAQGWSVPAWIEIKAMVEPILARQAAVESTLRRSASRLPKPCRHSGWRAVDNVSLDSESVVRTPHTIGESDVNIKRIVEAILFAANRPMTIKQIQEAFPEWSQPTGADILAALTSIAEDYQERPIGLKHLASGYRFQVREGMSTWLSRLFEEKPPRYSRALLETMAIIAYRQPVTRGEIEDIRGVSVSTNIVQTLLEREWIRVLGHKEVPGRPALYGTTKQFLDYFNLNSLTELPALMEIIDFDQSEDSRLTIQQDYREQTQTNTSENYAKNNTIPEPGSTQAANTDSEECADEYAPDQQRQLH